jgi:ribosome maturation factor RimP
MVEAVVEQIAALVSPELAMMGFDLIEVEYSGGILRLTIDRPGGVSLDDCVAVNRRVGLLLDALDPIQGRYKLEVSSPGLNRKIKATKEFEHFAGRKVKVQTKERTIKGIIKRLEGETLVLDIDDSESQVAVKDIIKANLDF